MKKIVFAIFALAAFTLTSCEKNSINIMEVDASNFNDTEEYCWHAIQTDQYGTEKVYYIWGTEKGLIEHLQGLGTIATEIGQTVKASYKKTNIGDENACEQKMMGLF